MTVDFLRATTKVVGSSIAQHYPLIPSMISTPLKVAAPVQSVKLTCMVIIRLPEKELEQLRNHQRPLPKRVAGEPGREYLA